MSGPVIHSVLLSAALACSACAGSTAEAPVQEQRLSAEDVAANNRGVGLMGRFEYDAAHDVFAALVEKHPDWTAVRLNLAIATLNRQAQGDETKALSLAEQVLADEPRNLRAHYIAGLLKLHSGDAEAAAAHFETVATGDPGDAYAAYHFAQTLSMRMRHEEAYTWYRRAMEREPYLRSAQYGAFQALQRQKKREEALAVLEEYRRLEKNPRSRLAEFKYTRMGEKADAVTVDLPGAGPPAPVSGPVFAQPEPLAVEGDLPALAPGAALTAADLDGDGRLDLIVTALGDAPATTAVLLGASEGGFRLAADHALAGIEGVNAVLVGDYDNDERSDVYLCRTGPNRLFRQGDGGAFEDVTSATGTANGERNCVDGAFFDADHDGDLDIFVVNADGPDELLNNNLDGTFRGIAAEQGLDGGERASRRLVVADLDQDRDADIVVIREDPPHSVFLNDRLWNYTEPETGFEALVKANLRAAVAADTDADGAAEIYGLDAQGALIRFAHDQRGGWSGASLAPGAGLGSSQLAVLDVTGDGTLDVLRSTARGWQVLKTGSGPVFEGRGAHAWLPVLLEPGRGPSVVGVADQGLRLWSAGPGRHPFLSMRLSGREAQAESMRSNASGIGNRVAVRTDSRWSVLTGFRSDSGPGQSLQPLAIGLGGAPSADFVAIDWSDGVFQSEMDLAAGELHAIAETQRQMSSCPVLFAWNGERYEFVTDFLGVGGIGYNLGAGEYAEPRPWENLLLPRDVLEPRDGRYLVKLTEPMEEAGYIDSVRLVAYDLPEGWDLVLDERMATGGPEATGAPLFFRAEALPVRAVNDRAEDVTLLVSEVDHRAAPSGPLDHRFIGRLAQDHALTLHFERPLDDGPGRPVLVMDGWVEYPYSQTSFAAWQAGADYRPPTLEAQGEDGEWETLLEQFGYPAGMPRRAAVPLPELPAGTRALRLTTNQEVYWDRLAVVWAEALDVTPRELPLAAASLDETGFARRTTGPQRLPHYDYDRRVPLWDTRHMEGYYTRFGPVEELVAAHDDAVAVYGPGEEIHVEFEALLPPTDAHSRRFVLETRGWAKDRDLFTRDGETVGPLPSSGRPREVAERLHAKYNTRFRVGG